MRALRGRAHQHAGVSSLKNAHSAAAEKVLAKANREVQRARLAEAISKIGGDKAEDHNGVKSGMVDPRIKLAQEAAKVAAEAGKEKNSKANKAATNA